MSVLTAAVVLAWVCLLVLTLAMAGILRQLRELQADMAQLVAPTWGGGGWQGAPGLGGTARRIPMPAGQGPLLLLVLDPGCSFCDEVHGPFTRLTGEYPGVRFEVLSPHDRWSGGPGVRSRVDPELVARLDLPWAPALLLADTIGTVLAAQPVRSPKRLDEQVAILLNTAQVPGSAPGSDPAQESDPTQDSATGRESATGRGSDTRERRGI